MAPGSWQVYICIIWARSQCHLIFSVKSCFSLLNFRRPDFSVSTQVGAHVGISIPARGTWRPWMRSLFLNLQAETFQIYENYSCELMAPGVMELLLCTENGISAVRTGFKDQLLRSICALACCLSVCWLSCIDSSPQRGTLRVKRPASFCRAEE
jgi:hypothetical protein